MAKAIIDCHFWYPCNYSPPLVGDRLPAKYAVAACRTVSSHCAQFVSRLKQRNMYQLLLYQSTVGGNIVKCFNVSPQIVYVYPVSMDITQGNTIYKKYENIFQVFYKA